MLSAVVTPNGLQLWRVGQGAADIVGAPAIIQNDAHAKTAGSPSYLSAGPGAACPANPTAALVVSKPSGAGALWRLAAAPGRGPGRYFIVRSIDSAT